MWKLEGILNGRYFREDWISYEGAITSRDRRLRPQRKRDYKSPTGYTTIYPIGWTAIRKKEEKKNAVQRHNRLDDVAILSLAEMAIRTEIQTNKDAWETWRKEMSLV